MRRTLAAVALATFTSFMVGGLAAPASAVCGGGEPGEPCHCPELKLIKIYC
ncbi:MAG TPA: hypothetical protein VGX28_12410 [Frankiaceae bacterium]|jgi:hypothetical protein|nr:hypothetical protein [Frankiaceae bacterium]